MRDGLALEVRNLHIAGDYTIAELQAIATTAEGVPFDNWYCWVCRFDDDLIVEVRAYLDSAMVAYVIGRADALSKKRLPTTRPGKGRSPSPQRNAPKLR
jgi:hypothetical protein